MKPKNKTTADAANERVPPQHTNRKTIFVVGLDDFHLDLLKTCPQSAETDFIGLIPKQQIVECESYPIEDYLIEAEAVFSTHHGRIDGIIGYWDFPTSTILPLLRDKANLPGPSLESVLRCEHKFWSRLCQKKAIPNGTVPNFQAVDIFAEEPRPALNFPYWLKPIKSHSSHLGFRIGNARALRGAITTIRDKIHRVAEPFDQIVQRAEMPPEVSVVGGYHCIAEEIISSSRQCTLEGYVYDGDTTVYGVVDTIRAGRSSVQTRFQFPSAVPEPIIARMIKVAHEVMTEIGYDVGPFNMEFFWDPKSRKIRLVEVNPRVSKSHAPLFWMVDGAAHFAVAIDLARGRKPEFPRREGKYRIAAKYMLRAQNDAKVTHAPSADDMAAFREELPEAIVNVFVDEGTQLSSLQDQDSYSFEFAELFIGADDEAQLREKYQRALDILPFRFDRKTRILS